MFKFGVVDFCFVRTSQGKLQDDLKKSEALCVQMKGLGFSFVWRVASGRDERSAVL